MNPIRLSTLLLLLYLKLSSVECIGGFLTEEENAALQKTCGQLPSRFKAMKGDIVNIAEAPWAVSLAGYSTASRNPDKKLSLCSGVLISPRHVITAAHCMANKDVFKAYDEDEMKVQMNIITIAPKDKTFVLGDQCSARMRSSCYNNNTGIAQFKKGRRVWVNPAYMEVNYYDLAIVELESDVVSDGGIRPLCIGTDFPQPGEEFKIYSYGAASVKLWDKKQDKLQRWTTKVVDCSIQEDAITSLKGEYRPLEYCTRSDNEQHSCGGDSGAGAVSLNTNGVYQLRGIHVRGQLCDYDSYPKYIFTEFQVGISPFVDWICDKTGVCPAGFSRRLSPGGQLVERQKITRLKCDNERNVFSYYGTNALCYHNFAHDVMTFNITTARDQCREWGAFLAPVRTREEYEAVIKTDLQFTSGYVYPKPNMRLIVDAQWSEEHNEFRWIIDSSKVMTLPKYWLNEKIEPLDEFGRDAHCLSLKWVGTKEAKFEPITCSHQEHAIACAKKPTIIWDI